MENEPIIDLSKVKPGWEEITNTLNSYLPLYNAWRDIYGGGTGQTLTEFLSAIGVFEYQSIERFFLETFLDTAQNDSSIYTITRMLGVRISRKKGATVGVKLFRTENIENTKIIPKFSIFRIGSQEFITLNNIIFDKGRDVAVGVLQQGSLKQYEFTFLGENFEKIEILSEENFSISDSPVKVTVEGVPYKTVFDGLWNYGPRDNVVYDSSDQFGNLILTFGNNVYGNRPEVNDRILVTYLETTGFLSEEFIAGNAVESLADSDISGVTTTSISKGSSEKDAEYYRVMAPHIHFAKNANTEDDYVAKASEYPGVVDCKIIPQRRIDPYDVRFMNVIWVSLLLEDGSSWDEELEKPQAPTFELDTGVLDPGTYWYQITAVNEIGESEPCDPVSFDVITPDSGIILNIEPQLNAKGYKIYGRDGVNFRFIDEVNRSDVSEDNTLVYLDTGEIIPDGDVNNENTTRANWFSFLKYMDKFKSDQVRLIQKSPEMKSIQVSVIIYCHYVIDNIEEIRTQAYINIRKIFEPKLGVLGRNYSIDDITRACNIKRIVNNNKDVKEELVDYTIVENPLSDSELITDYEWQFIFPSSITVEVLYTDRVRSGQKFRSNLI